MVPCREKIKKKIFLLFYIKRGERKFEQRGRVRYAQFYLHAIKMKTKKKKKPGVSVIY